MDEQSFDEAQQIRDLCRTSISGTHPHPNAQRCELYVRCRVRRQLKFVSCVILSILIPKAIYGNC